MRCDPLPTTHTPAPSAKEPVANFVELCLQLTESNEQVFEELRWAVGRLVDGLQARWLRVPRLARPAWATGGADAVGR